MTDYSWWTNDELIARIRKLEADLTASSSSASGIPISTPQDHTIALRDSEERIRAILQTAVEGIITIDDRGTVETMNPAAERLFGYSAAEVIGHNVKMLMPSPYREQHDGYLKNYHRTGHARIIGIGREVVGQRKDGSVFPMDLSVGEVRLAGRRVYTGILRDITARKQAEEKLAQMARSLAEKNKELETIVYVASHDLRSPLVNIQGFSNELERACRQVSQLISSSQCPLSPELKQILDQDVPEAIDFILAGVKKIDTLLNGFLRFSRLGRAALKLEPIEMNSLLASVIRSMEFQIKEAGATVRVAPLPPCHGDLVQLTQVFSNLLENAVKYRDPARPAEIEVSGKQEDGQSIYAVKDNGIGIAREHQHNIFEIFHRLNPSHGEGEGLGLTIAQRSLERQNGHITVESDRGAGSTFFVFLPATSK